MRARVDAARSLWKNFRVRLLRRHLILGGLALPCAARLARADEGAPTDVDAQARWLAGIDPPKALEASAEWRAYAQVENDRWQAAQPRIKAMDDWSTRELAPSLPADRAVLYPFAGPDALHAIALFGKTKRLFLIGLEPIGTLADPSKAPASGYFSRLGSSQGDLHRLGFFRTQEMASDFARTGVVATLVGTIVRMGGKVSSVQTAPAVRIDWTTRTGDVRRLDYVSADLANAGLKGQRQLIADIHALAPYVTFVKAGMYLLGDARFSYLRQTLLDESAVIVQDDTGIPIRHFDLHWAMRFFGAYDPPPPSYDDRAQADLKVALEHRSVAPLPFGFGYHVAPSKACLVVATAVKTK